MLSPLNRIPRQEIAVLMRRGMRVRGDGIELVYRVDKLRDSSTAPVTKHSRFGFVVSTKVDKRATARNRMRRLMSEAVRLMIKANRIPLLDGIFIARREMVGKTQEEVEVLVSQLLAKVVVH